VIDPGLIQPLALLFEDLHRVELVRPDFFK